MADTAVPEAERGDGWALTRTGSGLTSVVVALHGWDDATGVAREVDSNAFGPHSATPYLRCSAQAPGATRLFVTLVALTRDAVHPQALREAVSCAVTEEGRALIMFPDGETVSV